MKLRILAAGILAVSCSLVLEDRTGCGRFLELTLRDAPAYPVFVGIASPGHPSSPGNSSSPGYSASPGHSASLGYSATLLIDRDTVLYLNVPVSEVEVRAVCLSRQPSWPSPVSSAGPSSVSSSVCSSGLSSVSSAGLSSVSSAGLSPVSSAGSSSVSSSGQSPVSSSVCSSGLSSVSSAGSSSVSSAVCSSSVSSAVCSSGLSPVSSSVCSSGLSGSQAPDIAGPFEPVIISQGEDSPPVWLFRAVIPAGQADEEIPVPIDLQKSFCTVTLEFPGALPADGVVHSAASAAASGSPVAPTFPPPAAALATSIGSPVATVAGSLRIVGGVAGYDSFFRPLPGTFIFVLPMNVLPAEVPGSSQTPLCGSCSEFDSGEGRAQIWGRLENRGGTFPGDSAPGHPETQYGWGRSGPQNPTFPENALDLSQNHGGPSPTGPTFPENGLDLPQNHGGPSPTGPTFPENGLDLPQNAPDLPRPKVVEGTTWVLSCRLPRQVDGSLMLEVLGAGGEVIRTFALGEYILRAGYDWSAPSLEDIHIVMDLSVNRMDVIIGNYTDTRQFEILI